MTKTFIMVDKVTETMELKAVTCDKCGCECKNVYTDILCKPAFCDKPEFFESVCYKCFQKYYNNDNKSKITLIHKDGESTTIVNRT